MTPTISVIIPMYNAEKYIALTLETVLAQTFADFELILIDDASTDRTVGIAKSFDDRRIKIIELEKNMGGASGPGVVRNVGIEQASGEYVYSMDHDDVLMPDAFQIMLNAAVETGADAVINTKNLLVEKNEFTSLDEIPQLLIQERGKMNPIAADLKKRVLEEYALHKSPAAPWNHLYRREFLRQSGIRFRPIEIHDDGLFLIELLCATKNIIKIEELFYIWRQQNESITHSTLFNFEGFAKRVRSFLRIIDGIDEVLPPALEREYGEVDWCFIDLICLQIKNRAIVRALRHAYNTEPDKCWEIVRAELKAHYGADNPILRKMVHGYFLEVSHNKSIDEKENTRLRMTMKKLKEEVNRMIPF